MVEELLQLLVTEVDADLLEAVVLQETRLFDQAFCFVKFSHDI